MPLCLSLDFLQSLVFIIIIILALSVLLSQWWYSSLGHKLGFGVHWHTGDEVWAVITGATDGIGLEYAKQLGKIGYNLVIIARNRDKLNNTRKNLENVLKPEQKVKTICADFNQTDVSTYQTIADELIPLAEVYVLVNNVGTMYPIPEYYHKTPQSANKSIFNVNVMSVIKMLEIVLPKMLIKGRGVVITVSSQAGEQPFPLFSSYCASKAYVSQLSKSLAIEYESKGITFQSVVPNQVKTKLIANFTLPFMAVPVEDYVVAAMKTVGLEYCTPGHWKHRIIAQFERLSIAVIGEKLVVKIIFAVLSKIRANHYKYNNVSDVFV